MFLGSVHLNQTCFSVQSQYNHINHIKPRKHPHTSGCLPSLDPLHPSTEAQNPVQTSCQPAIASGVGATASFTSTLGAQRQTGIDSASAQKDGELVMVEGHCMVV